MLEHLSINLKYQEFYQAYLHLQDSLKLSMPVQ